MIFTGNKNFVCKINVFQGFFVPNITIYTKKDICTYCMFKRTPRLSNGSFLCTGRTNCTQVFILMSIIFWFISSERNFNQRINFTAFLLCVCKCKIIAGWHLAVIYYKSNVCENVAIWRKTIKM